MITDQSQPPEARARRGSYVHTCVCTRSRGAVCSFCTPCFAFGLLDTLLLGVTTANGAWVVLHAGENLRIKGGPPHTHSGMPKKNCLRAVLLLLLASLL